MGSFKIKGGHRLKGEITPQGAKNEALQILAGVLLTNEDVVVENIPNILDVNRMIQLLGGLGVSVNKLSEDTYRFNATNVDLEYLHTEEFRKKGASLRGSIMIVGPLVARFGKGYIPSPGGDKIGRRRLDTHFQGLEALGAKFEFPCAYWLYFVW